MTEEDRIAADGEEFIFNDNVTGGRIPKKFIPAIEKGFKEMVVKGPVAGFPVVNMAFNLDDGSYHDVDSSEMAFMLTAHECFRECFLKIKPVLLEPIMLVEIECPDIFQGSVVGNISAKRGIIVATDTVGKICRIIADVPLAETFGYSTELRSQTQGQGTFTMELCKYDQVPPNIQIEIVAERKKEQEAK